MCAFGLIFVGHSKNQERERENSFAGGAYLYQWRMKKVESEEAPMRFPLQSSFLDYKKQINIQKSNILFALSLSLSLSPKLRLCAHPVRFDRRRRREKGGFIYNKSKFMGFF